MNSAVVGNLKLLLSLDSSNFDKGVTSSEANVKKLADRLSKDLAPSQQRINALVRDFVGNKDIARALEFATAIDKVGGASKLTASEQARTNRVVQEAIEKYRALGQEAPPHLIALANATKQVHKPTEQLGTSMTSLMGKARSLAGVFGVTLGAGALVGFAKHTFDAADQIGDLALKMGVSTDAAQRFQFAARQSGAEIENVSQSIVKMNNNLAEGDKSTVAALAAAGLKFQDIRAMKPEDAFRTIADAIGRIPDPMMQSKIALELFGKSGAELLPMIREHSLRAADGARIMSEDTIEALKAAQQAWENFWNGITVIAGDAMADMLPQIKKFLADLKEGFQFLASFAGAEGNVQERIQVALGKGLIRHLSQESANRAKALAGFAGTGDAQEVGMGSGVFGFSPKGGGSGTFKTKDERDEEERRWKALASAAKAAEDAYRSFERQRITGFSDSERQRQAFELRFQKEHGLLEAYAAMRGLVKPFDRALLGSPLNIASGQKPAPSFSLPMKSIDLKALTKGAFDVDALMSGVNIPPERFAKSLQGMFGMLPQTLLASFQGGGNPLKSIASMFGGGILGAPSIMGTMKDGLFGGGIGKMLQGSLGKTIGGAIGGIIPGLGALLGPALGKLFGAIRGIFTNKTKEAREDFAKQSGFESLDNLYSKLRSVGAEGEKIANVGLNMIGKKDKSANEKWMKDVTAFFDRLERVPGKVAELSAALGKFGGAIPAQLDPLLDSILGDSNLSADLRKQLEGMRKPSWQAAQELASSFGIDSSALGKGFNQSRVADSAFELKRAVDLFGRFEGSDQNSILKDMADEFSGVASESKKTGVALPKAVEAFIRQIDAMGMLLDENGERIDSSLLQFADIEDEYQKQVVSLLQDIKDLLGGTGAYAPTVEAPKTGFGYWRRADGSVAPVGGGAPWDGNEGDQNIHMPSFAGGTRGQFIDFGAGTPVMLHGKERVITEAEGGGSRGGTVNFHASFLDGSSFETFLRRYGGAEAVARSLPDVIERWGRAQ